MSGNEIVYQGRKLSFELRTETLANGAKVTRELIRHPGAVVIMPRRADGSFVLIEQFRYAIGKTLLEFPAGTMEKGESPLECAKREIREETGYDAVKWTPLGELYPLPGYCDEILHLFLAEELTQGSMSLDQDEQIEPVEMYLGDVEAAVISGKLCDAKSISILYRAKLREVI